MTQLRQEGKDEGHIFLLNRYAINNVLIYHKAVHLDEIQLPPLSHVREKVKQVICVGPE